MSVVVPLLVLVPALAAILGILLRRSARASIAVAVGSASIGLVLAVIQVVDRVTTTPTGQGPASGSQLIETIGGLAAGDLEVPLQLLSDRQSAMVALAVAVVGLAVQVFGVWYLGAHVDERRAVFLAEVSLFLAAMLLLVQSDDLILTLVGWEVMGWCSYLLIGHTSSRASARRAAQKAFLVTRVADIGFVLGLVALAVRAGSTSVAAVLDTAHAGAVTGGTALTVALVALVVGVAGKSGLVPFHDWLPDAMEGPTPASALIHAATMVAAGTVVLARLHPLYAADPTSRAVLAVLAALTMVGAALLAFAQADVKRMLAYSTLSQVAIMLAALAVDLGSGSGESPVEDAALGHLVAHALSKSLLFLGIGWLSVLAGGTAFVVQRGRARHRGALQWSLAIGLASLAGVPPLVGFFGKDGVITVVEESTQARGFFSYTGVVTPAPVWPAWLLLVALMMTVVLTAAYCARAWLLLTTEPSLAAVEAVEGQVESAQAAAPAGDEEPTGELEGRRVSMPAALTVSGLAVLTVVGGVALLGFGSGLHLGWLLAALSVALVVATAALVVVRSHGGADPADALSPRLRARVESGFGVDTAYAGVGRVVIGLARLVARLDTDVVDAYPRAAARAAVLAGRAGDRAHRGAPSGGLVAVVVGVVAVGVAGVTLWR